MGRRRRIVVRDDRGDDGKCIVGGQPGGWITKEWRMGGGRTPRLCIVIF